MTREDIIRARFIGQQIAKAQGNNPAAGLPVSKSFEANAQAHARIGDDQGLPKDAKWLEKVYESFKF
jgi:hypothetical protein